MRLFSLESLARRRCGPGSRWAGTGRAFRRLVLAGALLAGGCDRTADPTGPAPEARPNHSPSSTAIPASAVPASVAQIPFPELSGLEEGVQDHLRRVEQRLREVLRSAQSTDAERAEALGRAGMAYHAYSLADAAGACYDLALLLRPGEPRWLYLRALVAEGEGDEDRALALLASAAELAPSSIPIRLAQGRIHATLQHTDQARAAFRAALGLDARCAAALLGLGRLDLAERRFEEARQLLAQARRAAPGATAIEYPLGLAFRGLGDSERALEHLRRRGTVEPRVGDPWLQAVRALRVGMRLHQNRGTSLFAEGLFEEALREFELAVREAPESALAHTNLGAVLTRLGRIPEARAELRCALQLDPEQAMAHFDLGILEARLGDDIAAIEHYRSSLAIQPSQVDCRFNLGNALRRLGRFEEALPEFEAVVCADPGRESARLAEVIVLARLRRFATARRRAEEGLAAVPESDALREALARLLACADAADVRDGSRALALARELLTRGSDLSRVECYAMALAEVGRFQEAVSVQVRAVEAARRAGRADLARGLEANLARYRLERPCREPWPPAPREGPRPDAGQQGAADPPRETGSGRSRGSAATEPRPWDAWAGGPDAARARRGISGCSSRCGPSSEWEARLSDRR